MNTRPLGCFQTYLYASQVLLDVQNAERLLSYWGTRKICLGLAITVKNVLLFV